MTRKSFAKGIRDLQTDAFEPVRAARIALAPPGVENSLYVSFRRTNYQFTPDDRPPNVMPFKEWQGHPARHAVRLEDDDRAALGQIISLMSRPQRPDIGLNYLQAYSNWRVMRDTGAPYPAFANRPRKKYSEVMKNLASLDRFFRQGLRAGSALEAAWVACDNPRQFGSRLSAEAPRVFNLSSHHGDNLAPQSDERKKLWSDYIPVVHLTMTMRKALIDAGVDTDSREWTNGEFMYHLLDARIPAEWMSRFLVEAERWSYRLYYQQIIPNPERMIRLILRDRELVLYRFRKALTRQGFSTGQSIDS